MKTNKITLLILASYTLVGFATMRRGVVYEVDTPTEDLFLSKENEQGVPLFKSVPLDDVRPTEQLHNLTIAPAPVAPAQGKITIHHAVSDDAVYYGRHLENPDDDDERISTDVASIGEGTDLDDPIAHLDAGGEESGDGMDDYDASQPEGKPNRMRKFGGSNKVIV